MKTWMCAQLWRIEQLTDGTYRIMPKAVPGQKRNWHWFHSAIVPQVWLLSISTAIILNGILGNNKSMMNPNLIY